MTLTDKVVVVTGGAGLLGRSFARAVVDAGGVAVIADVDGDAAARVAATVGAEASRARAARVDITDTGSVDALIAATQAAHGRIDAVVNNAYPRNARYGRKLEDVTYADFCDNVSTHLGGYFLVAQRFAGHFARQGGGLIVNMGSIYGVVPPRFEIYEGTAMTVPVEYAAIKSAVIHLTRYFAQYYKDRGVRCNAISPGGILDAQPRAFLEAYRRHAASKGMLDPQDVAATLVFLLSDGAAAINGQNLVVDDGWTL
jgi:NAD(P)-dependent dehydrogenase (short-subunit alcohol dehydrogenase family)